MFTWTARFFAILFIRTLGNVSPCSHKDIRFGAMLISLAVVNGAWLLFAYGHLFGYEPAGWALRLSIGALLIADWFAASLPWYRPCDDEWLFKMGD